MGERCCQETCAAGNHCIDGFVPVASYSTKVYPSNRECCEATCAAADYCQPGYVAKSDWSSRTSPDNWRCCHATPMPTPTFTESSRGYKTFILHPDEFLMWFGIV